MVIIEIALLPLQHGKIPDDPDSAAGQVHASALETVLSQPGLRRVRWGRQVEDSLLLIWLVDWDSVECHKKFMASTCVFSSIYFLILLILRQCIRTIPWPIG